MSIAAETENPGKKVILALQKMFARLKFSIFKAIDPAELYATLDMNQTDEHDAQEFALKLTDFLSESDATLRTIFDTNLNGSLQYERKCLSCQETAVVKENYSIIRLNPCDSLQQALGEKLEEEKLEYRCESCELGVEASRTLQFLTFPPVLQFEVNRYRYCPTAQRNIKIQSSFNFPDVIDFTPYLELKEGDSTENNKYTAFAALVHTGSRADCGHFVVRIRNHTTGTWHQFSDASLNQWDAEEDGMNASDNVYMVIYIRQLVLTAFPDNDLTTSNSAIEARLKTEVEEEDELLLAKKKAAHHNFIQRYNLINLVASTPKIGPVRDYYFFSNCWIREFLRSIDFPGDLIPVNNQVIEFNRF